MFDDPYKILGVSPDASDEEIKAQLGGVPLSTPEVLSWIGEYIEEGTK